MSVVQVVLWVDGRCIVMISSAILTLWQVCRYSGLDIPCFCYHEGLFIAGNCRMCLVAILGSRELVPSCGVSTWAGMEIYSGSYRVCNLRENILEFLLVNHPLDCPICDQGGECDLQDMSMSFGCEMGRHAEPRKRSVMKGLHYSLGVLVKMVMTRCVHCTRCVRFGGIVLGSREFGVLGRNVSNEIGMYLCGVVESELSGNVVDLCPVGILY